MEVTLDFVQDKSKDEISKLIKENTNKTVLNNLKGLLPGNFLKEIVGLLNLTETKPSELKKED